MSLQTTIGIAKLGTKSLRVTVPEGVVAYLDLQPGDLLSWRMEIQDGQKIVIVRRGAAENHDTMKIASKYARVREKTQNK